MKLFFSFVLSVGIMGHIMAQKTQEAASTIHDVTVYLSGAEITRTASVSVVPGLTDLVFTNLTTDINTNTIQVSATGDLVIMGAVYQYNYLSDTKEVTRVKTLQDSVDMLNLALEAIHNSKNVNSGLQSLLEKNESVGGQNGGVTAANLQAVYEYYQNKMTELKTAWSALDQQEKQVQLTLNKLNAQLNEMNQKKNQPTGEIVVTVSTKNYVNSVFNISYLVNQAGWTPQYDLRCENINSPVKLTYKADVHQKSGEDWNGVHLTLSTSNPTVSASRPVLQPWYLYYYNAAAYNGLDNNTNTVNAYSYQQTAPVEAKEKNTDSDGIADKMDQEAESPANYTTVNNQQLSVEFDIALPYDIPSDSKTHKVEVQDYTVPAIYEYYAVPKMDNDAFLLARVTDWSKLNLLSGNANIFFEGAYVGQSYINTATTKDTLDLSLGRDKKIIIKRLKEKDYTKQKFIGNDVKESFNYTITIRNTKTDDITIKLFDQFPISNNADIKVTRDDSGGATVDDVTGKLTWSITVKPGEDKKMKFSFTVEFPKNQSIQGL